MAEATIASGLAATGIPYTLDARPGAYAGILYFWVLRALSAANIQNLRWRVSKDDEFVIVNPFTGQPFPFAPDGTPMKGLSFKTEEERQAFIAAHWSGPVVAMVETPVK
ncbi:hypothetical protein JH25_26350 [Pseudomonas sp. BRG-100]|nr:hypothetical protein JH25_26350 [Pseudomonas sp. BRG-100]